MADLSNIIDGLDNQIDFKNDSVEAVVKAAFNAGGRCQAALLTVENLAPGENLEEYTTGILEVTNPIGQFLDDLTDDQEAAYRAGLKKVITHQIPEVEAALEAFADASLDLTAAVKAMNEQIDALETGDEA